MAVYVVVITFVFSHFLALYRSPIAAAVVESALSCLVLLSNCHHRIRFTLSNCKGYLVFVVIAFVFSRFFALHRPLIVATVVGSALGCLVLLSNCRHCIQSALLNCKDYLVFLSLLLCYGVLAFRLCKCQLSPFRLRLKVNLKGNRSLTTFKSYHG